MPVPFIHLADVHLGRLQGNGLNAAQLAQRRTETLLTLHRVLDAVQQEEVPLLLIAGDFFEYDLVDKTTVVEVCNRLATLTATKVFIVSGNHDYAAPDSFYRTLEWPTNVHLFLGAWEAIQVPELGVTVHGTGFHTPECDEPRLRGYQVHDVVADEKVNDDLHIVLLHAMLTTGSSPHMPVSSDDITNCGADYVALGHLHDPRILLEVGGLVRAAYSGILEPRGFSECGPHGYMRGMLETGGARLEFVPIATRDYTRVTIDITGLGTMEALTHAALQALADVPTHHLVRLVLQGSRSQDFTLDTSRLGNLGERFYHFQCVDETTPDDDLTVMAEGFSVRAAFVRNLLDRIKGGTPEEQAQAQRALQAGLAALAGREVDM